MIVKFFDNSETIVSKSEAERIESAIMRGVKLLKINGMTVASGTVAYIRPGGYSEADKVPTSRRLARPDHRGEASPALEKLRAKWGKPDVSPGQQEAT